MTPLGYADTLRSDQVSMQPKQADLFRAMTPAQKLEVAGQLYEAAWELKARKIFRRAHT